MSESILSRPRFSDDEIVKLLKSNYGLQGQLTSLASERDQNVRITTSKTTSSDNCSFVLKIANASASFSQLECETLAMKHFAESQIKHSCPEVIPSINGKLIVQASSRNHSEKSQSHFFRLLSYLPGVPLADSKALTPAELFQLGKFFGEVSTTFADFDHPVAHRDFHWNLDSIDSTLQSKICYLKDSHQRFLVEQQWHQYQAVVQPHLKSFRKSIIHNDCNDHNLIVQQTPYDCTFGLIDFGDMVFASTINELAIALAYLLMNRDQPLVTASSLVQGYHTTFPLLEVELEILFSLIQMRLCNSVVMSAYQQSLQPENEYLSISEKSAWNLLEQLSQIKSTTALEVFRQACGFPTSKFFPKFDSDQLLNARKQRLNPALSLSYEKPLHVVRGSRQYLIDASGQAYLDMVNNVCHVGHCHPHVVQEAQQQIAKLNTNTRYLYEQLTEYAERLTKSLPDPLNVCFFVCSGSEANDLALRMACCATGGSEVIILDHAYHGNLSTLIDISPYKHNGPGGQGAPSHVHTAAIPDDYRGKFRRDDSYIAEKYAEEMDSIIERIQNNKMQLCAFMAESVLGCGGQVVLPKGYLQAVYEKVRSAGGVCIADEVQVGFGRVGTHFWGFETQQVVPDIVTMGKPIGNGHPMAAVVTTKEIADKFANGMEYFNTFGGNPVSCAIGMAVLDVIQREHLQQNALQVGQYLKTKLELLQKKYSLIGDVRGLGLFLGIELVRDRDTLEPADQEASHIIEKMRDRHILLSTDGPLHNVVKIKPPMVFNQRNAEFFIFNLEQVLAEVSK